MFTPMPGITLAQAQAKLDLWLAAEDKVAAGQSYQIGNRAMKRADLPEIRESIKFWESKVIRLEATNGRGGIRIRGATPMD